MTTVTFPGGGGGGGGLHFRDPVDVFADEAARTTYFTTTDADAYQEFARDRSLAIIIGTLANPTDFQTYTGSGTTYDDDDWVDRIDAVQGPKGDRGDDGDDALYHVTIFMNAATLPTAAPTGGSVVVATQTVTPPTGWTNLPSAPSTGESIYESRATIRPAEQTGTVTPTWSIPIPSGIEDADAYVEALNDARDAAQTAEDEANAAETSATAAASSATAAASSATSAATSATGAEAAADRAEAAESTGGSDDDKADTDLQNIDDDLTLAEQRIVLDRIGELLDASRGWAQGSADYVGRLSRNYLTGEVRICIDIPIVETDGSGTWTEVSISNLDIGDRNTTTAVLNDFLYDPVDDHFYFGAAEPGHTVAWVQDIAQDALDDALTATENTAHWLNQHHSDDAARTQINSLLTGDDNDTLPASTDFFYYNRPDRKIRKLTLSTYNAPGTLRHHYIWVPLYGNLLGTYIIPDATGRLREPTEKDFHEFRLAFDGIKTQRVVRHLEAGHGASATFTEYTPSGFRGVLQRDNQVTSPDEGDWYYNVGNHAGHFREYNFRLASFREEWFNRHAPTNWRGEFNTEQEALAHITGNNQLVVYRATPSSVRRLYRSSNYVAPADDKVSYSWGALRPPPDVSVHFSDEYQLNEDSTTQNVDGSGNYQPASDAPCQVLTTAHEIAISKVTFAILFNATFSEAQDYEIVIATLDSSNEITGFFLHGADAQSSVDQTTIQELEFELPDAIHIPGSTRFLVGIVNPAAGQSFAVWDEDDEDSLGDGLDTFESHGLYTLPSGYDVGDALTQVTSPNTGDMRFKMEYAVVNQGAGNQLFLDVPTQAEAEDYDSPTVYMWPVKRVGETAVAATNAQAPEIIFTEDTDPTWPDGWRSVTLDRALSNDDAHRTIELELYFQTQDIRSIHEFCSVQDWLNLDVKDSTSATVVDSLGDVMLLPRFTLAGTNPITQFYIARGHTNNTTFLLTYAGRQTTDRFRLTIRLV